MTDCWSEGTPFRLFLYKERIVQAPEKAIAEKIVDFDAANKNIDESYNQLTTTANYIIQLLQSLNSSTWQRVNEISDMLEMYLGNDTVYKTELGYMFLSPEIQEILPNMEQFFSTLRSRSRDLSDCWTRLSEDYRMIFGKMLKEPTTMAFYQHLSRDMEQYTTTDNESVATFYLKHFQYLIHPKRTEIFMVAPDVRATCLNADFTKLAICINADFSTRNWTSANNSLTNFFQQAEYNTDVSRMMDNKDARYTGAIKKVQSSLDKFILGNEINFEFYRWVDWIDS